MPDYPSAIWSPNNNFFPDTGKKSFIIVHGTAGGSSAQGIADYFKSTEGGSEPVSSHYIVGQDGTVVQTISEKDGSYANGVVNNPNWTGNPNYYTISIEHVKLSTDNSNALTPEQQKSSFALIKDICQRNGIGMHEADNNTGIAPHASIDPINRARCPGALDWNALWTYLNGGDQPMTIDLTNPTVASHFSGTDNTMWTCKNGFVIGHAILDFYRKFGGDALCGLTHLGLPTGVENGIAGKIGTVYQRFERGVLIYDPSRLIDNPPGSTGPVYMAHIDSGVGQDPQITILQGKIASLQQSTLAQELQAEQTKLAQIKQLASS